MTVNFVAGEPQFLDHLVPVWHALPPEQRGRFLVVAGLQKRARRLGINPVADIDETAFAGPTLVAAVSDVHRVEQRGILQIAFIEHGAGQSYGGDPASAHHPSYSGGSGRQSVSLTLCPSRQAADRWRAAYPEMAVRIVGCPKLDDLPERGPGPRPVLAISFHHNANNGCPEGNSAFHHYRPVLPVLAEAFDLIGHSHPRRSHLYRPWFERMGVPFVEDFADVCRRADVYAVDNSSTLFEFAATGRPVVVLNSPDYRRDIDHGLRFEGRATCPITPHPHFCGAGHVGVQVDGPEGVWDKRDYRRVVEAVELAIADPDPVREAREAALKLAYAYRKGAAKRAATALAAWAETRTVAA